MRRGARNHVEYWERIEGIDYTSISRSSGRTTTAFSHFTFYRKYDQRHANYDKIISLPHDRRVELLEINFLLT